MSSCDGKFINLLSNSDSTLPTLGYHQQPQPPAKQTTRWECGGSFSEEVRNTEPVTVSPKFKYRVGYWWSDKKGQKLNAQELSSLFAERQCEFVKLDFDRHLDQQGPFDVIVHKISDILVKAGQGDAVAKKTINAFESYVRKHPNLVVLDPLDNNRALLDRYEQYRLIEQCELAKENVVFTPPFVHLTSANIDVNRGRIRRSRITFPIVCKPILAQGSTGAHQMCIIFNEAGLKDVKPPCVAQSFVNHNARLFKLFVIKDKYYVMERPSLKNFHNVAESQETVFFYSHDISKPNSSSSLTELDEIDKLNLEYLMQKWQNNLRLRDYMGLPPASCNPHLEEDATQGEDHEDSGSDCTISNGKEIGPTSCTDGRDISNKLKTSASNNQRQTRLETQQEHDKNSDQSSRKFPPLVPSDEILSKIVRIFSEKLGLTFYGIDIIIENETSRYAIIDMNTFPGYDGVESFLAIFRDIVCDAIPKMTDQSNVTANGHLLNLKVPKRKTTEHDSGIEST